jgi:hypothetical protein
VDHRTDVKDLATPGVRSLRGRLYPKSDPVDPGDRMTAGKAPALGAVTPRRFYDLPHAGRIPGFGLGFVSRSRRTGVERFIDDDGDDRLGGLPDKLA